MTNWIKQPFTSENPTKGKLLVVVGTYSIGKERIVVGIAKALGTKIYASAGKRRICGCLEDEELMDMITDDPKEGQVHMTRFVPLQIPNFLIQANPSLHYNALITAIPPFVQPPSLIS